MFQKKIISVFLLIFCMAVMSAKLSFAQTETSILFVAPHRVVLEDGKKIAVINIANKSNEIRRYDLTVIDQVMNEFGVTQRRKTFEYSAKRMLRFVPKRITLKPGERQTIRVQARRPKNLADGDYHSHLLFREIPLSTVDKQALKKEREEDAQKTSFEIKALYGIAVPVIVHQGKISSRLSFQNAKIIAATETAPKHLSVEFVRSGNAESSALMKMEFIQENAKPISLIKPQWVRLYREVDLITKKIKLEKAAKDIDFSKGQIVFSLTKKSKNPKEADIIKQSVLTP